MLHFREMHRPFVDSSRACPKRQNETLLEVPLRRDVRKRWLIRRMSKTRTGESFQNKLNGMTLIQTKIARMTR